MIPDYRTTARASGITTDAERSRIAKALEAFLLRLDNSRRLSLAVLGMIIVFSVSLSTGVALTRRPWCDEGWFASPAYNLIHHGYMGMTILDPHGFVFAPFVQGIERFTYWVMPGYLLMQALWYEIFGLSLFSMRAISVAWSVVALLAWFKVIHALTGNRRVATLAVLLLGTEQHFVLSAASARMDMMCSAMGLASIALYLSLRQHFLRAVAAASLVLSCAVFTHPNALFGFLALLILVLVLDRRRITIRAVLIASVPFLACSMLWGLYVARSPGAFFSQMAAQGKIPHRFEVSLNVLAMLKNEFLLRYANAYGFNSHFPISLTAFIVVVYVTAIAAVTVLPQLRHRRGVALLIGMFLVTLALLTCLQKNWYYLVYILPFYAALAAVFLVWLYEKSLPLRVVAMLTLAAVICLHVAILGARIWHNDYSHRYLAVTKYLKDHVAPGELVMGSGELGFQLGFDGQVLDDCRLGRLSGRTPDYVVLEAQYVVFWWSWFHTNEPDSSKYVLELLRDKYTVAYDQAGDKYPVLGFSDQPYKVYRRVRKRPGDKVSQTAAGAL